MQQVDTSPGKRQLQQRHRPPDHQHERPDDDHRDGAVQGRVHVHCRRHDADRVSCRIYSVKWSNLVWLIEVSIGQAFCG